MNDKITIIDQDPTPFFGALQSELVLAELLHLRVDLAGDRMPLAARAGGGDHKEIQKRRRLAEVEQEDVLSSVLIGNPGGNPGMLEGHVKAAGFAAIDGPRGDFLLGRAD